MIVILSSIIGLLGYLFSKQIRKNYMTLIVLTTIIAFASIVIESEVTEIVTQGFIGLAFFIIVMFAGALPRQSKISKKLRSVRKEYSILGFILLFPHAYTFIIQFLDGSYPVEWIGIIAFIIMVPLFIISFDKVKRKMNMKKWNKIQKWSYLVYALIFVHLIIVSEGANLISYSIIFGLYTFLKLENYLFKSYEIRLRTIYSLLVIGLLGGITYLGLNFEGISSSSLDDIDFGDYEITDGIYTGSATGFKNLVTELTVTVENGKITNIEFEEIGATGPHHGTDYEEAVYDMVVNILEAQSTDIDSISGATKTTQSVLDAVNDALEDEIQIEE